jgi:hemerythrin-like metal-binding protein
MLDVSIQTATRATRADAMELNQPLPRRATSSTEGMERVSDEERRKSPHRYCSVLSEVLAGPKHTDKYLGPAVVVDLSEHGLALQTDFRLRVGNSLYVRNRYFAVSAVVLNSRRMDVGFRAGVEFTSEVRWTTAPVPVRPSRASGEHPFLFRPVVTRDEHARHTNSRTVTNSEGGAGFRSGIAAMRRLADMWSAWLTPAVRALKRTVSPHRWVQPLSHTALQRSFEHINMQHDQLDSLLRGLQAIVGTSDLRLLHATIDDLAGCMRTHFQNEEQLMRRVGYRELRAHQWQHEMLLNDLELVRARLTTEHVKGDDLVEQLKVMIDEHVEDTDSHFVNYCHTL